jgi:hypothetical protein
MAKLALAGGTPIRTRPFSRWSEFGDEEREALLDVLERGDWGGYPSPNTCARLFNKQFASYQGAKYGIAAAIAKIQANAEELSKIPRPPHAPRL